MQVATSDSKWTYSSRSKPDPRFERQFETDAIGSAHRQQQLVGDPQLSDLAALRFDEDRA